MARIHAIAVVAIIAGGTAAWLLLAQPPPMAPPLPTAAPGDDQDAAATAAPGDAARAVLPPATTAADAPARAEPAPDDGAAASTAAPAAPANVQLAVQALVSRQPLAEFHWSFRPDVGASTLRGDGRHGRAAFDLPPGTAGRLLVEADGLAAATQDLVAPPAGAAPIRIDVALAPLPVASGVVLQAQRQDTPIERLRLDVWRLADDPGAIDLGIATDADPDDEPLWSRTGTAAGGAFDLPSLSPGRYALRAQPVADDGAPLPLLPYRHRFAWAGHEQLPLVASFAPGIVLRLLAPDDRQPALDCQVEASGSGGVVSLWWRSPHDGRPTAIGRDVVELPGAVTTLLAVPNDAWRLRVLAHGQELQVVPAGEEASVRTFSAVLPR